MYILFFWLLFISFFFLIVILQYSSAVASDDNDYSGPVNPKKNLEEEYMGYEAKVKYLQHDFVNSVFMENMNYNSGCIDIVREHSRIGKTTILLSPNGRLGGLGITNLKFNGIREIYPKSLSMLYSVRH